MKPVLVYVDDEERNLTVFEATMPEDWTVKCFDSAVEALKAIKAINPWLIVSDQKMPHMTGLEFLEVSSQILPDAVRIVVTGQTEESTIIQLIRRAKIFDYITKPWNSESMLAQLQTGIDYYRAILERKQAIEQLNAKNLELEKSNAELKRLTQELAESNAREVDLRNEIGAWAPAPIVRAILEKSVKFPVQRDLVGITYDIVESSSLNGQMVEGHPVKSHVLKIFTEALIKKGGLRESSSGDSVYGHFGAVQPHGKSGEFHQSAMMAAQEFRVSLRSFSKIHRIDVECGLALHFAPDTLVQVHEIHVETDHGMVVQKSFDTDSIHIDLLHRMEKLVHHLPGSNIIMSEEFLKGLPDPSGRIVKLGPMLFKGQSTPVVLHLLPSDRVNDEILEAFKKEYFSQAPDSRAA